MKETAAKVSMISLANGAFEARAGTAIPYKRFVELTEEFEKVAGLNAGGNSGLSFQESGLRRRCVKGIAYAGALEELQKRGILVRLSA